MYSWELKQCPAHNGPLNHVNPGTSVLKEKKLKEKALYLEGERSSYKLNLRKRVFRGEKAGGQQCGTLDEFKSKKSVR